MANNPNLYNAIIAGATGANQQRWITDPVSGNYATFQAAVVALATNIDDAIAPISGDASVGASALMQSIVQGVFADRFVQSSVEASYDSIVGPIVALWTELSSALDPAGSGSIAPLAHTMFVDQDTEVAVESQDGSIAAPFATLQAAHDALPADVRGTIVVCQTGEDGLGDLITTKPIAVIGLTTGRNNAVINSITVDGNHDLDLQNVFVGAVSEGQEVAFNVTAVQCEFTTFSNADGNSTLTDCTLTGSLSTGNTIIRDCTIQGPVSCDGIDGFDSDFNGGLAVVFTIGNEGARMRNCTLDSYTISSNFSEFILDHCAISGEDAMTLNSANIAHSIINSPMTITNGLDMTHTEVGGTGEGTSPITCANANIFACTLTGDLTVSAELQIDTLTYQKALNSGWNIPIAGINFVLVDQPLSDTISINVPASDATTTTYVNTSLVGSALEDLFDTDDPVIVNPAADLVGAGATIASARISAANTLRVGFRGVTTGGAANFVVTRGR